MDEDGKASERGPRAMSRVLRLFSLMSDHPEGLSLADISALMKVPKSTLLSSLRGLVLDDYLVLEGTIYRLGPRVFRLAAEISSEWSLTRISRGYMRSLADRTGETVALSIIDLEAHRFIHIDVIEGVNPIRYVHRVGSGGPLYATATGKVLLAFQTPEYQDRYLSEADLKPFTGRTVIDPKRLAEQLEEVRKVHYYVNLGEIETEGAAIAAPIFGPNNQIVASLSIAVPLARLAASQDSLRAAVCEVARHVSGTD